MRKDGEEVLAVERGEGRKVCPGPPGSALLIK